MPEDEQSQKDSVRAATWQEVIDEIADFYRSQGISEEFSVCGSDFCGTSQELEERYPESNGRCPWCEVYFIDEDGACHTRRKTNRA